VDSHCKINGEVIEGYEIYPIGWLSGLPDEMKADPGKFAFKPMEVTAMEWDAWNNSLRHGKMVGWRKDLTLNDCVFEKIANYDDIEIAKADTKKKKENK
jgi:hypothetical protein